LGIGFPNPNYGNFDEENGDKTIYLWEFNIALEHHHVQKRYIIELNVPWLSMA
jgi:hypothetical protein